MLLGIPPQSSTLPHSKLNMSVERIRDLKAHTIPCLNSHLCQKCDAAPQALRRSTLDGPGKPCPKE